MQLVLPRILYSWQGFCLLNNVAIGAAYAWEDPILGHVHGDYMRLYMFIRDYMWLAWWWWWRWWWWWCWCWRWRWRWRRRRRWWWWWLMLRMILIHYYIYICLHIIIYELLYITSKSLGMKISSKNPMAYMVGLYPLDLINYQWRKSWFHGIYWDLWGYMMVYPLVN